MRRPFIGGNWKMNGNAASIEALSQGITHGLADYSAAEVVVFPSFVYLTQVRDLLKNSQIGLGAQNLSVQDKGALTGEISGAMLRDVGCHYVLVGHSARRTFYNEDDSLIAQKFAIAQKHQLTPVLCIGETQEERAAGKTKQIVTTQLNTIITKCGIEALKNAVVAYEPVWAIGTGLTATPEEVQEVHAFIRENLAKENAKIANTLRIIYGGSLKSHNATAIFDMPDIDGGLIGGASLDVEEFIGICKAQKLVST